MALEPGNEWIARHSDDSGNGKWHQHRRCGAQACHDDDERGGSDQRSQDGIGKSMLWQECLRLKSVVRLRRHRLG